MSKRDYYEVLGVGKSASKDEIKKLTASFLKNITRTSTKKPERMKNSKKSKKPMKHFLMTKNGPITTSLATPIQIRDLAAEVSAAATSAALGLTIFSQAFSEAAQGGETRMPRGRAPICSIR